MIETISIATEYRFSREQEYANFASFKSLKGFSSTDYENVESETRALRIGLSWFAGVKLTFKIGCCPPCPKAGAPGI
jgi:hypothetical protein